METLLKHIQDQLSKRKYCTVFATQLEQVWPTNRREKKDRDAAIHAFAAKHGMSASITDPGVRVTFRKL